MVSVSGHRKQEAPVGDGNAKPKAKKLNVRQSKFVDGVIRHGKRKKAAQEAGYIGKAAGVRAAKLVKLPHVAEAIERGVRQANSAALVDAEFVLSGLRLVAEKCMGKSKIMKHDMVRGGPVETVDFDSSGANRSLELLGKHLKLLTDRVEHVSTNVAEDLSEARDRLKRAGS